MTSGGNAKRHFCVWATIAFFVIAMLCAVESTTGGDSVFRGLALGALVFGVLSFAGVWANGLPKSEDQ